jgi:phage gp45-like
MSNIMDNGTVLPSGLLGSQGPEAAIAGFNRSYRNTSLKAGIVVNSYPADDPLNLTKLCVEYDVLVMEQFENKGSTPILYRHCMSSQGLGSLADYFELTLRPKTFQTNKGFPTFKDQDGAIVMILCLDGVGEKAVVIGNLAHPDRVTNITSPDPQLFGEYNGVNVEIKKDGSCSLTFKGATDSKGIPIDASQGPTKFEIKTDGSFEFKHSTVDILADKSGALTITTKADCKITTETDCTITATATATIEGKDIKLGSGASEALILGDTFKKYFDIHTHATVLGPSSPPTSPMPPTTLSKKTKTE